MNDPSPESEKLFGDLLVEQGLAKPGHVRECLALQNELRARNVSPLPKLGELLLQKGYLTPETYQQTVSLQRGQEKIKTGSREEVFVPPDAMEALEREENRFGKYVRVVPLGVGGMGEVWKAWDTDLGRWVALKFLKSARPEDLVRFRREAQTAGQVDHPNIAAIYEVGEKSGKPYIAMQYVEGQTLSIFPRYDIREVVRLMRDTALAIHAAHEKGIIHRDLKPSNLMVAKKETTHVYVMDFGLAKETEVDMSISQSGLVLGTPAYMSPEQARGKIGRLDARSDVYSLGATFYELLTDRPPFHDADVLNLLHKVVQIEPVPVRKRKPQIDPDLETIVMKCLRKEPEKRYPTAAALAEDLSNYLEGKSISGRPMGLTEKTSRWVKRNRALTTTLATLLLLVVGGGIFYRLNTEKNKDRALAELRGDVNGVLGEIRSGEGITKEEAQKKVLQHREPETVEMLVRELDALTHALKNTGKLAGDQERYLLFLCETLGLLGIRKGAVDGLGRYLKTERKKDQLRAIPAGKALCFLGGEEANRLLLRTRTGFGINSPFWLQVRDEYARTNMNPVLESESAEGYFSRGTLRRDKDDLEGAIADFSTAIKLDPGYVLAWAYRGNARRARRDFDGAIADHSRALELDKNLVLSWRARGNARKVKGDLNGAIADQTRAIEIDPKEAKNWNSRGSTRHQKGDLDGAISDYTRAIDLDPKVANFWLNIGKTRAKKGELDRAISDCTSAIEIDPKFVKAWITRGGIRGNMNDLDGAIADFTRAIQIDSKSVDAWNNRGLARQAKGDLDGAITDLTRALELVPEFVNARLNRGFARKTRGRLSGAISDFEQVLKRAPDHPQSTAIRAEIKKMRAHLEKQKEK